MSVHIDGPVGRRWNQVNVQNSQQDQQRIIGLLSRISVSNGGKKEEWFAPILPGGDGDCSPYLLSAIWDFQKYWLARGLFHNIDGVVDPEGHTLFRMNMFAEGGAPPDPPLDLKPIIRNERVPGTFQVTSMWSASIGEIGQVGGVKVEITEPSGKKFEILGGGGGFGVSVDPSQYEKWWDGIEDPVAKVALGPLKEMLIKGVGFNFGDYVQLLAPDLFAQLTKGVLIANPINKYLGRPTHVTRYMITEGGNSTFRIFSIGGGVYWGGESGFIGFGGPPLGPPFVHPVLGCYGSLGATGKIGAGIQAMIYYTISVRDKKTAADQVAVL